MAFRGISFGSHPYQIPISVGAPAADQGFLYATSPPLRLDTIEKIDSPERLEQQIVQFDSQFKEVEQRLKECEKRMAEVNEQLRIDKLQRNAYAVEAKHLNGTKRDEYYAQLDILWHQNCEISAHAQVYYQNQETGEIESIGLRTVLGEILEARKALGIPIPSYQPQFELLSFSERSSSEKGLRGRSLTEKSKKARLEEAQVELAELDQQALEIVEQMDALDKLLPFKEEWEAVDARIHQYQQEQQVLGDQINSLIKEKGDIEQMRGDAHRLLLLAQRKAHQKH